MSIRSVLDIVIHVENFRNIDLYYQGIYFLRFKIYYEENGKRIYAHPYILSENYKPYNQDQQNQIKGNRLMDNQIFSQAQIVDPTSSFLTKQFIIKFCEEEVELNDICHFRVEIETKPGFEKQELFMECDLIFIDQQSNNFVPQNQKNQQVYEQHCPDKSRLLSTCKYKIKEAFNGIHEFIPALFEDQNFCVANIMFHTLLLDYRFRVCQMQLSEFAQVKQEDRMALIEGGLKLNQNQQKDDKASMYNYIKKQFKNIDYQQMYQIFVESLKKAYEQLYNHYNFISQKCILDKQKKAFKKYLQPPMKLIIPEYVTQDNVRSVSLDKDFNAKISEKFRTKEPEAITHALLNEANLISGQLFQLWHKYLDLFKISPRFCSAVLQYNYQKITKSKYQQYIQQENKEDKEKLLTQPKHIFEQRIKTSKKMREIIQKQDKFNNYENNIEFLGFYPQAEIAPIVFEEYTPAPDSPQPNEENIIDNETENNDDVDNGYYRGIHLFILVHGLQGNSFDMKLMKNYLNYLHPESMFLCSSINEESTEGDIEEMGQKLASEVTNFIFDNCPGNTLGRISFIGHSLGGLIIRSALRFLDEFKDKMYTFLTLSSLHLGYIYNSSKIIDAGIWFLKRWKKSLCLQQLSLSEKPNFKDCFLYKLSQSQCLNWFKNIVLLSSQQDQYSPFESARIEIGEAAKQDAQNGAYYMEMAENILKDIPASSLFRMEVNFNITDRNIDSFIGRAAHIQFLESTPLIRLIVHNYEQFFN